MGFEIVMQPQAQERGVVVLDHGFVSSFEIIQGVTAPEAAYYLGQDAAVLIWLPPNSYGVLEVFVKTGAGAGSPYFVFNYEVFNCARVHADDKELTEKLADGKPVEIQLPTVALATGPKMWEVHCPPGSGQFTLIECEAGKHGACVQVDGGYQVKCVAGGPG